MAQNSRLSDQLSLNSAFSQVIACIMLVIFLNGLFSAINVGDNINSLLKASKIIKCDNVQKALGT